VVVSLSFKSYENKTLHEVFSISS